MQFTADKEKYNAGKPGEFTYAAALNLSSEVIPRTRELRNLHSKINAINIYNPITSFKHLRTYRNEFLLLAPKAESEIDSCLNKIAEPVEGASSSDLAWVQGFTLASGLSAFHNLQSAYTSVGEALDRKSAYSMSMFSLYFAVISLIIPILIA